MRLLGFAGLVGIAAVVAIARPDVVEAIYQQVYPSDPVQRRALDQCFLENHRFDRFDPAARETCFRQYAAATAAASALEQHMTAAVNFVDQWRAAGQGRLPPNDIRAEQRGERYMRTSSAGPNR